MESMMWQLVMVPTRVYLGSHPPAAAAEQLDYAHYENTVPQLVHHVLASLVLLKASNGKASPSVRMQASKSPLPMG